MPAVGHAYVHRRPKVPGETRLRSGMDEARSGHEKAADWVRHNVLEFARGMPEVMVGDVLIAEVK
jgi:hypothetical protein